MVATHCPAGSLWTLAALTQLRRLTIDVHEPYMNTISQHLQPLTTLTSLDLSRLGSGPLRDNVQVGAGLCTGGIDGSCRPLAGIASGVGGSRLWQWCWEQDACSMMLLLQAVWRLHDSMHLPDGTLGLQCTTYDLMPHGPAVHAWSAQRPQ